MYSPYPFNEHQQLEERSVRHRERDLGHKRALKERTPTEGIVSRIMGTLDRGRRHLARLARHLRVGLTIRSGHPFSHRIGSGHAVHHHKPIGP